MVKEIIWKKWIDPFAYARKNHKLPAKRPVQAIVTSAGVIPICQPNNGSNIFNFWLMHSNFDLTQKIIDDICTVPGVETFDPQTRYRARVGIGQLFNEVHVQKGIENLVCDEPPQALWAIVKCPDGSTKTVRADSEEALKKQCDGCETIAGKMA